jgi:hypothetical protein
MADRHGMPLKVGDGVILSRAGDPRNLLSGLVFDSSLATDT